VAAPDEQRVAGIEKVFIDKYCRMNNCGSLDISVPQSGVIPIIVMICDDCRRAAEACRTGIAPWLIPASRLSHILHLKPAISLHCIAISSSSRTRLPGWLSPAWRKPGAEKDAGENLIPAHHDATPNLEIVYRNVTITIRPFRLAR
jgi:hypothetical protein